MNRVMNPVHVRGDHKQPQHPVDPLRDRDIAVIEHCGGIEQNLENHHRHYRWTKQYDGSHLDQHGEDYLNGMEACAGGDVIVEVGMVDPVQAPEQGDGVDHDMLQVDDEIHRHHGDDDRERKRDRNGVEQSPTLLLGEQRHAHRGCRKEQAQNHCIERDETEIVDPARTLGNSELTARRVDLPQSDDRKHAEKENQTDREFVAEYPLIPIHDQLSSKTFSAIIFYMSINQ